MEGLEDLTILSSKALGEGAFSTVLKCLSKRDGKIYALKVVDVARLTSQDCDNLRFEIQLHMQLQHPHIIRFVDCLQIANIVYILLEYAANGCLFFYVHPQDGLPEHIALRFFYQTAQSLKHLHDRNLIHRDLKPENLLLDERFDVKLCDFGWSCRITSPEDYRTSICGTYEYMSPEILFEEKHSTKVDIWCLGVLLYELLHGAPPFQGGSVEEMKSALGKRNIVIFDHFSTETKQLFRCLLRKDPRKRPDIDEVLRHPAILRNKQRLEQPLSMQDFEILMRNYLLNTNDATTHPLPFFASDMERFAQRASVPSEFVTQSPVDPQDDQLAFNFVAAPASDRMSHTRPSDSRRRSTKSSQGSRPSLELQAMIQMGEAGILPPMPNPAAEEKWASVAPKRILIKLDGNVKGASNDTMAKSYRTFIRDNTEPAAVPNITGNFKRKSPANDVFVTEDSSDQPVLATPSTARSRLPSSGGEKQAAFSTKLQSSAQSQSSNSTQASRVEPNTTEERRAGKALNVSRINLGDFDSTKIRLLSEMSPLSLAGQGPKHKASLELPQKHSVTTETRAQGAQNISSQGNNVHTPNAEKRNSMAPRSFSTEVSAARISQKLSELKEIPTRRSNAGALSPAISSEDISESLPRATKRIDLSKLDSHTIFQASKF